MSCSICPLVLILNVSGYGIGGGLSGGAGEGLHGSWDGGGEILVDAVEEGGVGVGLGFAGGGRLGDGGVGRVHRIESWVEQAHGDNGGDDQRGCGPDEGEGDEAALLSAVDGGEARPDGPAGQLAVGDCHGCVVKAGDGGTHEIELGGADEAVAEVFLLGLGESGGEKSAVLGGADEKVAELLVIEVLGGLEIHRASLVESLERL